MRTGDLASTARENGSLATTERAEVYTAEPTVRQTVLVNKGVDNKTLDRSADPTMEIAKKSHPIVWAGGLAAAAIVIVVVVLMLGAPKDDAQTIPAGSVVASTVPTSTTSRLALNAFPWAEVIHVKNLANGKALQFPEQLVTPTSIDLPPGRYEVVLMNPKFEPITRTIEIAPYEDETLMVEFTAPSESSLPKFEGNFR
ncbi:MAG TPA: PEGA domain-containing protein [Thermoanaerobaculia bacterium]